MNYQVASIPVFSNRIHPGDPVSIATHESIRLVHHGANSELLHLKEIDTHILLGGIIEASRVAIEAVDSRELYWLAWVLDLSNIGLPQLDSHVSGLKLNPNKGVIGEKNLGLKSFVLALVDDNIWSDLLVPDSAIRVAHSRLGTSIGLGRSGFISLEEGVCGDDHREVIDGEEAVRVLQGLLVLQVVLHKHKEGGLVEGPDLS